MIVDSLPNCGAYIPVSEGVAAALEFLRSHKDETLAPGRYEISGDDVYALVMSYETKPEESGKYEAHQRYVDVQYVVKGEERMGYAEVSSLNATGEYSIEKDFVLLDGPGDFLTIKAGMFAVFFPQDAHMPGIMVGSPQSVTKIVVKIRV
jgi:biofilm protein TabA